MLSLSITKEECEPGIQVYRDGSLVQEWNSISDCQAQQQDEMLLG
jgi:hypothetical protein